MLPNIKYYNKAKHTTNTPTPLPPPPKKKKTFQLICLTVIFCHPSYESAHIDWSHL